MKIKKIGFKNVLYFKKVLEFNSLDFFFRQKMKSANHVLVECQVYIMKKKKT